MRTVIRKLLALPEKDRELVYALIEALYKGVTSEAKADAEAASQGEHGFPR